MANEEHVKIIQQGTIIWNEWREKHPRVKPDLNQTCLRGVDLRGANLSEADLRRVDFRETNLNDADLSRATLTSANLNNSDLSEADLLHTDLIHADLQCAKLNDADLSNADLRGADLSSATLTSANLNDADLSTADLSNADLRETDLRGTDLSSANLNGANLTKATCGWTIFGDVDLQLVEGLETIDHEGPSTIGVDTLERSRGNIPEAFLRETGMSDNFIAYARSLVVKPIEYYTCFISYSSKDEMFAQRLRADLQSKGVR